ARHAAVWQFHELGRGVQAILLQQRRQRRQRMTRHIKAEQFLFVRQQFVLRPLGQTADGLGRRRRLLFKSAEEGALPLLFVGKDSRRARERPVNLREQRG